MGPIFISSETYQPGNSAPKTGKDIKKGCIGNGRNGSFPVYWAPPTQSSNTNSRSARSRKGTHALKKKKNLFPPPLLPAEDRTADGKCYLVPVWPAHPQHLLSFTVYN